MHGGDAFIPSSDTLAYLLSLAVVASGLCGLGLLAVSAFQNRSAPLRHGVLLATLTLLLLAPMPNKAAWPWST